MKFLSALFVVILSSVLIVSCANPREQKVKVNDAAQRINTEQKVCIDGVVYLAQYVYGGNIVLTP